MNYILKAYALQDIGNRTNQEDCFFPPFVDLCHYDETTREWCYYDGAPHTDDRLFIVCDGMGGHDRGEVASQTVVQAMSTSLLKSSSLGGMFKDEMIRSAIDEALKQLAAQDKPTEVRKMGTTMTVLIFHSQGATIGHIGDSRVYHFRPASKSQPARIMSRTQDHTIINELLMKGRITEEQAKRSTRKHILSRAMMSYQDDHPEVDIQHVTDIQPGDIFMLCTDGVFENMDDDTLCTLLTDPNYSDVQRVQNILHETLNNRDNHTAIVVRVQDILQSPDNSQDKALPQGTVIKSERYTYHIEKVLGQGAFGITYLVNTNVSMQGQLGTINTGVQVALKEFCMNAEMKREGTDLVEISPDSNVKTYAEKFRREASKLARLSHPNIVRVLEVFEANNTIYYAMEYLPDGSLNDYVNRKGGLPEKEAIACIRQIASALLYMHTNKILHLDVKPANVMRSVSTDTLKLIDFGLAKKYVETGEAESSANLGFGTSGYAPIEQADPNIEHDFSPSLDVYALGATYYKLLTGMVPDNAVDVLNRGLRTLPLVKKKVSQQSIMAIKAAMEPIKAKRLQNVQAFLDMLPRVDDEAAFAQPRTLRLWRWMLLALAVTIFSLGLVVVVYRYIRMSSVTSERVHKLNLDIPMVEVPGGTFVMGCDESKYPNCEEDEKPMHNVTLSSFSISKYEVTQALWRAVMEDAEVGKSKNGNYPVFNASWDEIQTFIKRLNKKTGRHFRLPTEAEWEYAARGGADTQFSGSADLDSVGWYADNSGNRLHPVGALAPNPLGIYDMSGNVWEYCSDWYGDYKDADETNPIGAAKGDFHVIRGGSWNCSSHYCRISFRQDNSLVSSMPDVGFRLVE